MSYNSPQHCYSPKAMIDSISVVIITKNAANTLKDTLCSLRDFSEVVVLDNGSDDETESIARQFDNVSFHVGTFDGFGPTKNKAASLSTNDWVLSLDADESPDFSLLNAIRQWSTDTPENHYGVILRENYFMGKAIHRGGWGNDRLVRLFNRRCLQFNNARVHESVEVSERGTAVVLKGVIRHNAVQNINQLLTKVNRYSELRHRDILENNKIPAPVFIVVKALFAFTRSYIFQLGIMEGWRGLVIACSNANGVFFKYIKAHAAKHQ